MVQRKQPEEKVDGRKAWVHRAGDWRTVREKGEMGVEGQTFTHRRQEA